MRRDRERRGKNEHERRSRHRRLPTVPDKTRLALLAHAMRADIRAMHGERELRKRERSNEEPNTSAGSHAAVVISPRASAANNVARRWRAQHRRC